MMASGVQGQLLEINVLGCRNLRDKEWFSRQDPYVVIVYASTRFRTKTDTDGGKNPAFNQKFMLPLIEGLREVNVEVWNSNTVQFDDFIGSGRILLDKALTIGYDDSTWNLTSRRGKYAGELRVILHFNKMVKPPPALAPAATPVSQYNQYNPPPPQTYPPYGPPAAAPYSPYPSTSSYYPERPGEYRPPYAGQHQTPPGPYGSQQYPPPPTSGYGAPYAPAPPSYAPPPPAPPAGYPPVYQEYPYRPY